MQSTYILEFQDYCSEPVLRSFRGKKGRNVFKDLRAITAKAEEDGYKGKSSELPDKYFIDMGYIPVKDAEYFSAEESVLGYHVVPARCEHCQKFEDGYCSRYGIVSNEPYTQCDRYTNCTAREVTYAGEGIGVYFTTVCGKGEPTIETVITELAEAGIDVKKCIDKRIPKDADFNYDYLGLSRE